MAASDQMGDGPPSKRTKFGEEGKMMLILIISYSHIILHAGIKYYNRYIQINLNPPFATNIPSVIFSQIYYFVPF